MAPTLLPLVFGFIFIFLLFNRQVTKKLDPLDYAAPSKDGQYIYGLSIEVNPYPVCPLFAPR